MQNSLSRMQLAIGSIFGTQTFTDTNRDLKSRNTHLLTRHTLSLSLLKLMNLINLCSQAADRRKQIRNKRQKSTIETEASTENQ